MRVFEEEWGRDGVGEESTNFTINFSPEAYEPFVAETDDALFLFHDASLFRVSTVSMAKSLKAQQLSSKPTMSPSGFCMV